MNSMKPLIKRIEVIFVDLNQGGEIVATDNRGRPVSVKMSDELKSRFLPSAPGTIMPDGSVYGGISPDTGHTFYAAAHDAPNVMTWPAAIDYARHSAAHGRSDWRLPSPGELKMMFNNRAVIGGFRSSGWYWSSEEDYNYKARSQSFRHGNQAFGNQLYGHKNQELSVRCVRGGRLPA